MAKFVPQFEIVYESIDMNYQNLPILIFNDRGHEFTFIYYRESFGNYNHVFKTVEYFRGPIVLDDSIDLVINFSQLIRYSFERINDVINIMKKYKEPTKSIIYNDMMTPEGFFKYHSIPNFSYNDTFYVNQISALKQFPYFKEFHKYLVKYKKIKKDVTVNIDVIKISKKYKKKQKVKLWLFKYFEYLTHSKKTSEHGCHRSTFGEN